MATLLLVGIATARLGLKGADLRLDCKGIRIAIPLDFKTVVYSERKSLVSVLGDQGPETERVKSVSWG